MTKAATAWFQVEISPNHEEDHGDGPAALSPEVAADFPNVGVGRDSHRIFQLNVELVDQLGVRRCRSVVQQGVPDTVLAAASRES